MTDLELRELDAQIAVEVFGDVLVKVRACKSDPLVLMRKIRPGEIGIFNRFYLEDGTKLYLGNPFAPAKLEYYSIDIRAAWEVVEKLRADDWLVAVKIQPDCGAFIIEGSRSEYDSPSRDLKAGKGKVCCELQDMRNGQKYRHSEWSFADTAPLAICLAALKAARANPAASPAPG